MPPRPPIDPRPWRPAPAPARARQRRGSVPLPPLEVFEVGGTGPEDVVVAGDGTLYTGTGDGLVRRLRVLAPDSVKIDVVADTGGRPLGLEWMPDGRLLVCDAERGLLAVDTVTGLSAARGPAGLQEAVTVLVDARANGIRLCNNAAVGRDGTVWFTDSSARFSLPDWRADIIEHSGTGRLLRRDPDGTIEPLVGGLDFANGVALLPDESAVFFAETGGYRVSKLHLTGDREGKVEVVLDNLPGFPDNLSLGGDGLVWIAMASPRERLLDRIAPRRPAVRRAAWKVPVRLQPGPKRFAWVMAVDPATGRVVHDLQGRDRDFWMTTGVREQRGRVWLGSLRGTTVAAFRVPS